MHVDRVQAQNRTSDEREVVDEARDRLKQCVNAWNRNHELAETDIEMRSGDQWDDEVVKQREEDARPTLTFNRLETYIQQVVGEQRKNRPGIHVAPADVDLEEEIPGQEQTAQGEPIKYRTSDVLEGMIRQIEYRSRSDAARDTAFDQAVGNGFGFYRIVTEYASETSFDQEVRVKRIRNPFSVLMDPAMETVTGEDATFAFISDWITKDEFRNLYDVEPVDELPQGVGEDRTLWWADDKIRIVEYFRKVPVEHTIALVAAPVIEGDAQPTTVDLGEAPEEGRRQIEARGGRIIRERTVKRPRVEWRLLNGSKVLEGPIEFPSKYIPVIPVWGREIIDDGETIYQSLIRHALDAQKNYNYWRSAMTELVALAPKSPWVGPATAFAGFEQRWEQANRKNYAYLPYNDQAPAPPQRERAGEVPQGATQEAQSADYDMKATIGMFEASIGEQSNERSGRAIQARRQEGETGNYIFLDNLNRAIEHEGRIILDMIPRVYDTPRVVRVRQIDGEGDFVQVNQDTPNGRMADITRGQWDVTVKAGPSYQTQREEFVNSLYDASRAYPNLWQVAGDLLVQNMEWPSSEKIAERLRKTMPAQLLADEPGEIPEQPPTPEQQLQQFELQVREAEAKAKMQDAEAKGQKADASIIQEDMNTRQSYYEMQTEVYQMLGRLQELQQKMEDMDIETIVQQTAAGTVQTLQEQGYLSGGSSEQRGSTAQEE